MQVKVRQSADNISLLVQIYMHVSSEDKLPRYARQVILPEIGIEGQLRLGASKISVVGCGATGTNISNLLARAGIGNLNIIDRDFVELTNLQRQIIFDEDDLHVPKALAIVKKLKTINSDVNIKPVVKDLNSTNAEDILRSSDLILDGTDNMETRFLINDVCVKLGVPWIYCGAVGTYGMVMAIIPGTTSCFRCFLPNVPPSGALQTCDVAGVLNTIPSMMAAIATTEAMKIVLERKTDICTNLIVYDAWNQEQQKITVPKNPSCKCCAKLEFEFLETKKEDLITALCGRDAIQIVPSRGGDIKLEQMTYKLDKVGDVKCNEYVLIFKDNETDYEITLFRDGRAIIKGTRDIDVAKSVYSRFIGT